ncbi:MAG: Wzz/FepE/Etk N-terminal domain-containing protein [Pseudomonadota bacterium]|nr:Wzz/FepE/Etk N-terminal domain-containing protein [Pseudomonadota bacterium]
MDWREWDALRTTRTRELDLGLVCEAITARKRWLTGLPLAALILIGVVLCLQPPRYSAETQVLIGPRQAGLIGLRSSFAVLDSAGGFGAATSQAELIASRDLARRAIKDLGIEDNPEFDPVTRGLGPGFRALIFLGILRDPARKSPEDRVLEAYQDRLRVSGPDRGGLVTIAFQSEDRELAANAANRIAELYLEMRADAKHAADLPRNTDARIVSRAVAPQHPLYPREAWLVLSGAAMIVMAFGAFVSIVLPRGRLPLRAEAPLEQPRALGQVRVFARFKDVAGLSPRLNPKLDPPPAIEGETGGEDPDNGQAMTKIVTRILAMPARGPQGFRQGIRIVATGLKAIGAASCMMLDLARDLAREGRSIVIGLDEFSLLDFESSTAGAPHGHPPGAEPTLGDLLAGTASFAEVIRRDPASRLHFLPVGRNGELDLHEFANVLDALAGIYDFIVTIAPPLDRNGIAGTLAAKADVVLLAAPGEPRGGAVFEAETRLIESGAREVLLIGLPAESPRRLGLDAA